MKIKKYEVRRKMREAKQKQFQKDLEKLMKLIFKQNKKITDISINAVSIRRDGKKIVNGLSWSKEDLIKSRRKYVPQEQDAPGGKNGNR